MIRKGTKVRMSPAFKRMSRQCGTPFTWIRAHIKEFGDCIGVVEGKVNYNNDPHGKPITFSEVNVHWKPSNLRYAYFPNQLVRVK